MSQTERARLESISNVSLYSAGINSASIKYSFKVAERHIVGESILELGPAEGVMTELLAATGKRLTLVEGSGLFCDSSPPSISGGKYYPRSIRGIPTKRAIRQHHSWARS